MPLANPLEAYEEFFPAIDVSTIRFHGNAVTALIRNLFIKSSRLFAHHPIIRAAVAAITLFMLAPLAWIANRQAGRRDATIFAPNWTSAVLQFRVRKKPEAAAHTVRGRRVAAERQPVAKSLAGTTST
jgi:hypothetical protein